MTNGIRTFWVISLMIFLTGCGGYRMGQVSVAGDPAATVGSEEGVLVKPGDKVRVTLQDGHQLKGRYLSQEAGTLLIEVEDSGDTEAGPGHEAFETMVPDSLVIPIGDIRDLAKFQSGTAGGILAGVMVVTVVGGAIFAHNFKPMGN